MDINMILRISLLLFLCLAAYMDIREKQISVLFIACGFAAGVCLQLLLGTMQLYDAAGGCMIGMFVLLTAFITGQQIGYGDGMILVTTGVFLGVLDNAILLLSSLFFAAVSGFFLLRKKRIKRKQRMPFIPFLFAGYIFVLLL